MADTVTDAGSALIGAGGGGAGGDARPQFVSVTFTTTDVSASITGVKHKTLVGFSVGRCSGTLPAHANITIPNLDEAPNASGYWDVTSSTLTFNRQVVTSGTAATESFSLILWGY